MESGANGQVIDLEGKYVLTDAGLQYCVKRGIPLRDVVLHDRRKATGFLWKRFNAAFVQKFVTHQLLASIDIERLELLSKRREIMAIASEIIYGVLFKKFRPEMKARLREQAIIQSMLARMGPAVTTGTSILPGAIAHFKDRHARAINAIKHSLYFAPAARVDTDDKLSATDREEKKRIVRRFIDQIDDETWFLFALLQTGEDRERLLKELQGIVDAYVERAAIADYTALILMELVQNAERAHLLNLAERDQMVRNNPAQVEHLLTDPTFRQKLFRRAQTNGEFLVLNFQFDGNPHDPTSKTKIMASVINRGLIGYRSRQDILEKKKRDVRTTSLVHFYKESNMQELGAGLGMYYLNYLQEACERQGILFDSNVVRDERKEETIASVVLRI